ncbi:MAG: acyl-CoA dehydrogenase family protein [Acetobacteraceae bacterium]
MDFAYSPELEELRARLGHFMTPHVAPRDADWQAAAQQGCLALAVPEPLKRKARLGPGRIHHCMRTIGQLGPALVLQVARAKSRHAFGGTLSDFANIQHWIAGQHLEIDQARLRTLHAASLMDKAGNQVARGDASATKVVAARMLTQVLDRAIQLFGGAGLTEDPPLARRRTWGRALGCIAGPDEVHVRTVARAELKKWTIAADAH